MIGNQRPRLSAFPLYVQSSLGQEGTELAAHAGLYLDDWQSWSLGHILAIRNGKWAAFEACEIVGRQNGKGAILEARELVGLFLVPTDVEMLHTAHEFKTARKHFYRLIYLIQNTPDLDRRVAKINESHGQEAIVLKPTPTIITGSNGRQIRRSVTKQLEIIARSQGSGRGFTADFLAYDEAMILDALKVGATLPTLSARPNPQVVYMASAGFKHSTQLGKIRRLALSGTSKSLFFGEWSIDPCDEYCPPDCTEHDKPGTVEAYAKSNPAMGIRISLEYLENEAEGMDDNEHLRERLGVGEYPAPLDGWFVIPRAWYEACEDNRNGELPNDLRQIVFAVWTAPDRSYTSIAVAGLRPDGLVGIQIIERHSGTGWVLKRLVELHRRWHPAAFIVDKRSEAGSFITDMESNRLPVEAVGATEMAYSCGHIFDGFRDDWIRHYGQETLRKSIAAADKRLLSEAWAWDTRNVAVDISPLVSSTLAVGGYMRFGRGSDVDIRKSVHFDYDEIVRLTKAGLYGPDDLKRLADRGLITEDEIPAILQAARE